jgi:hypothetical protein
MNTLTIACVVMIAALAWVAFADHPTAANLRTALADTLPLL